MLLLMLCGCVAVRVRNIPGDRWKKAQVQELAGWWCTNDKELWRCEITGNNEMLIGSIAKRANDQFELLDSIAIPTRLGNRDLLFVRIKTKIATEAGYGFVLMQFKDKDHLTLVFPNGDAFAKLTEDKTLDGKLINYESSEKHFVYVSGDGRGYLDIINDMPDDQLFDSRFKLELTRLSLP